MSDLVARAEAAMEGVTAGPWVVNRDGWACVSSGSDSVFHGYFEGTCGDCGDDINDAAEVAISIEDAEFIAAARTLVPELAAALKAARAETERLANHERIVAILTDALHPRSDGYGIHPVFIERLAERLVET